MAGKQRLATAQWQESTLRQGNTTRYFRYYRPANLPAQAPVVILFHGGNQSMEKIFDPRSGGTQAWVSLAQQQKFLLIVPNGSNAETGETKGDRQNWNDCRRQSATLDRVDDVDFTRQLIDWATTTQGANPRQIYATGASNGGMMSYRAAIELGDRLAGVVAFIANMPQENECPTAKQAVPMAIINGTADPIMPWAGGVVSGGDTTVVSTTATVNYWLNVNGLNQVRPTVSRLPNVNRTDRSLVILRRYSSGQQEVAYYEVVGGGHTMPSVQYEIPPLTQRRLVGNQNRDIEGSAIAWDFLQRQRLPRP
jgi:polyhydroxybutyrate depolymerase